MFRAILCGVCALTITMMDAFGQDGYQKPPQAVVDILDAPAPPALSVSPTGDNLLLVQTDRYPSIEEVAAPMLRLAGAAHQPEDQRPGTAGAGHRAGAHAGHRRRAEADRAAREGAGSGSRTGRRTASGSRC